MRHISVKIDEELGEQVDEYADDEHQGVRSDAVRDLLRRGLDYDSMKAELDDARRQLRETNRRIDETNELVAWVDEQREIERRRLDREEMRDTAGVLTRAKWWLTGMPSESE